jgi:hypothetical protein
MMRKNFNFKREIKSYPNFSFDKPTIIYELLNSHEHKLKIEFIFSINSIITIDEKKYICGPPEKMISFGEINILNCEEKQIGYLDFYGSAFKNKKLVLLPSELNTTSEEWEINTNTNIFKKKFWKKSIVDVELKNGKQTISYTKEKRKLNLKNFLNDNKDKNIRVELSESLNNEFLLTGLIIYIVELLEFDRRNN